MARTFDADTIALPRTRANEAVTLANQLAAAAEGQKAVPAVPKLVQSSLTSIAALCGALQTELAAGPAAGTPTKEEADAQEDDGVVAIDTILKGWQILAKYITEGKTADGLRGRLFPHGVRFTTGRYETEWGIVQTTLKTITDESLDQQFKEIGMAPALEFLRGAHAVYGAVLGTGAPLAEPPAVGKAKNALLDAIRLFTIRVIGQIEDDKPETQALADALLLPLEEWKAAKTPAKTPKAPKGPATPAAPPGGGTPPGP